VARCDDQWLTAGDLAHRRVIRLKRVARPTASEYLTRCSYAAGRAGYWPISNRQPAVCCRRPGQSAT